MAHPGEGKTHQADRLLPRRAATRRSPPPDGAFGLMRTANLHHRQHRPLPPSTMHHRLTRIGDPACAENCQFGGSDSWPSRHRAARRIDCLPGLASSATDAIAQRLRIRRQLCVCW